MPSAGPNSPATAVDDSSVGTAQWFTPGDALTSNDLYAAAPLGSNETSHYLKVTNFGFSIPAGNVVNGVLVEYEVSASGGVTNDNSVRLVVGGTITGSDRATGTIWPAADTYLSRGGSSDNWGLSLTASDVNASNFGVAISAHAGAGGDEADIDHVRITLTYTPAAPAGRKARPTVALMRAALR